MLNFSNKKMGVSKNLPKSLGSTYMLSWEYTVHESWLNFFLFPSSSFFCFFSLSVLFDHPLLFSFWFSFLLWYNFLHCKTFSHINSHYLPSTVSLHCVNKTVSDSLLGHLADSARAGLQTCADRTNSALRRLVKRDRSQSEEGQREREASRRTISNTAAKSRQNTA